MSICYVDVPSRADDNININSNIDYESKEKLKHMFLEKYVNSSQVHCPTVNYEFKISLVPNHIPSFSRPRRLSQYEKSEVEYSSPIVLVPKKNQDTLRMCNGIIRKSDSEYSSPIVVVPKKNQDTLRMSYRTST
ncbi:hypothetical protein QE152_g17920 [Popillia japonica]|uniref:Uncharacterized protein n=1 Tax=Popillia japonica TaxID=7064 RepID=A0AAW1L685_POPJA